MWNVWNKLVWFPEETPYNDCGSDYVPCPRCGEFYCPKCPADLFKEMNNRLKKVLTSSISKEEFLGELDDEEILDLKGECSCGFSFIYNSKLAEWRKMRYLFDKK